MDINVRITFDASDKLTQMVFAIAAMVVPALEDAESEPEPKSTPSPEPAPKPEPKPAPEPKLYGVYAMAESLASKPESAPTSEPAPTTAYKMSAVPDPAPKPEPSPTTAPTPEPKPAQNAEKAKTLTIDDVRRVCLRATKAGKTKVVTDFLDAQGVKNLPALDPSLYDALVTVVEDNL